MQAYVLTVFLLKVTDVSMIIKITLIMTAGTSLLLWLGDQITNKGIGNGQSLLIMASIVLSLPSVFTGAYQAFIGAGTYASWVGILFFIIYLIMYFLVIVGVVWISLAERKIRKYTGIVERAFAEFKRTGNIELFRQRLKIYSSRVVIARAIGNSSFDWLTKGVVANYNELRYHVDDLKNDTETFLKNVYFDLLTKYSCSCPYFLKQSRNEESIYNLYSNMKRNRTLVFEKNIGVKKNTILEWIRKIDPMYSDAGKDYYRIVIEYLEQIKVE